jgi:hypothetical protein
MVSGFLTPLPPVGAIRATHPIPESLPEPPASWAQPFAAIAAEAVNLSMTSLRDGHALAARFWDPLLANAAVHHIWLPGEKQWNPAEERVSRS